MKAPLFLASLLFIGIASSPLGAAPVINIGFTTGTDGNEPNTNSSPLSGEQVVDPTSSWVNNGGSLALATDYSSGSATLAGRSLVMKVDSTPEDRQHSLINIKANDADFSLAQDYRITFETLLNGSVGDLSKNSLRVNFYNTTFDFPGLQASLVLYDESILLISGAQSTSIDNVWSADTVLNWQIDILYSIGELRVTLNSSYIGNLTLSPSGLSGIGGIEFVNGADDSSYELALANIQGSAIPEPSSLILLTAGGVLGFFFFNRKRHAA